MSHLDQLLSNIELHLQDGNFFLIISNIDPFKQQTFFDTRIKQDLPFFQETSTRQLNDSKGYYLRNPLLTKRNNELPKTFPSQNENEQISNIDIRNIIEKELEPYVIQIKNDLSTQLEGYLKEMEKYNYIQPEINKMQKNISDNSKQYDIYQDENNKKINAVNQKLLMLSKQFEEMKTSLLSVTRTVNTFNQVNKELNDKIPEIEHLTSKITNVEVSNERLYKDIENNLLKNFDQRTEYFQSNINTLRNFCNDFQSKLNLIELSQSKLVNNNLNTNEMINEIRSEFEETKKNVFNISVISQNAINNVEQYNDKITTLDKKITDMKKQYNELNQNLLTLELGFNSIDSELKNIQDSISKTQEDILQMNLEQKNRKNDNSILNSNLNELNEKIKSIESKLSEIKNDVFINQLTCEKLNTNFSSEQDKKIQLIQETQKDIELLKKQINDNPTLINKLQKLKEEIDRVEYSVKNNDKRLDSQIKVINENFSNLKKKFQDNKTIISEHTKTIKELSSQFKLLEK